jgi:AcrR family transcriptional regulator
VEAARTVFARQGIDAARINEITDEADVGFGSFYNHFDSKEAIVAAVIEETARSVGATIDAATAELDDPAEVVAVAHRTVLRAATEDPEFGWLLVRLEITHDLATAALGPYAMRDLRHGIAEGRFTVEDAGLALASTGGALLGVVRVVLNGHDADDAARQHVAGVLRWLGVPGGEADQIAARPLPDPGQV